MRKLTEIIVHCTATPEGRDFSVAQITEMHKARGFSTIGYHFLIGINGEVRNGRPVEQVGAHVQGHNATSIGVSYVGGLTSDGKKAKDTRTNNQKLALEQIIHDLLVKYPTITKVAGHRDYSPDLNHNGSIEPAEWIKFCPCFDAIPEYRDIVQQVRGGH